MHSAQQFVQDSFFVTHFFRGIQDTVFRIYRVPYFGAIVAGPSLVVVPQIHPLGIFGAFSVVDVDRILLSPLAMCCVLCNVVGLYALYISVMDAAQSDDR